MPDDTPPDDTPAPLAQPDRETLSPPAACGTVISGEVAPDAPQPERETLPPPAVVDADYGLVNGDSADDVQPDPADAGQPDEEPGL